MAFSVRLFVFWTTAILVYVKPAVANDTDTRIDALEWLASKVNALSIKNEGALHTLEKQVPVNLSQYSIQQTLTSRIASNQNVAFDARINSTTIHVAGGHAVKFDLVIVNQGRGYDVGKGRFTCPTHGLYQFATTIPSQHANIDYELVMDNHQLARLHGNDHGADQATQVVVMECAVGQQVWVRHVRSVHDAGNINGKSQWASFSGHLVAAF